MERYDVIVIYWALVILLCEVLSLRAHAPFMPEMSWLAAVSLSVFIFTMAALAIYKVWQEIRRK